MQSGKYLYKNLK